VRSLLAYIKENHGGVFRRVAFSSMLEPFIKLNQEVGVKKAKLREIEQRINELDMFKTLLNNLRDSLSINTGKSGLYLTQTSIMRGGGATAAPANKSNENLINEEDACMQKFV
jgi:cell shape-determining protein MreC